MSMRAWVIAGVTLGALACDDGDGSAEPASDLGAVGPAPIADAAPLDAGEWALDGGEPGRDAETPPPDGAPPPPDATAAECGGGEQRCVQDGAPETLSCGPDRRWTVDRCPEGDVCVGDGRCIPDPAACSPGQEVCLDLDTPASCNPGVGWSPLAPCPDGLVCSGAGQCRVPGCAPEVVGRSYLGCDFVATDLPNLAFAPLGGTPDSPLGIVVTNAQGGVVTHLTLRDAAGRLAALVGEVEIVPSLSTIGYTPVTVRSEVRGGDGTVQDEGFVQANQLELPPGGVAVLLVPHHAYTEQSSRLPNAWRLTTDQPVAAYQFSPYCCNFSVTNDASLLLPESTLGTEYFFLGVPSWQHTRGVEVEGGGLPATLTVIGTQHATHVTITLPAGASIQPGPAGSFDINGQVVTATLARDEVLTLMSGLPRVDAQFLATGVDLSGARIEADRPVAVFAGHLCTYFPQDQEACDHLEEQLFPTDTWGNRFLLAPPVLRTRQPEVATEAIFWKILARDADTQVVLSVPFADLAPRPPGFVGVPDCAGALAADGRTLRLGAGQHCEFGTRAPVAVQADKPIEVMGVISGQASTAVGFDFNAHAGDPAIFLAPPQQQYRQRYDFLAPSTYYSDYVTVVVPAGGDLSLDGVPVPLDDAEAIPGAEAVFAHLTIEDGPHRLVGSRPFGILVYAYDDYVSYAFTGGLNLNKR